jgi:hypothetical protein
MIQEHYGVVPDRIPETAGRWVSFETRLLATPHRKGIPVSFPDSVRQRFLHMRASWPSTGRLTGPSSKPSYCINPVKLYRMFRPAISIGGDMGCSRQLWARSLPFHIRYSLSAFWVLEPATGQRPRSYDYPPRTICCNNQSLKPLSQHLIPGNATRLRNRARRRKMRGVAGMHF